MTSADQGKRPRRHETAPRRQAPHPQSPQPEARDREARDREARRPGVPEEQAPPAFGAEIRQAVRYENGLAVKALIALAIVAVLIASRLLGG